MSGSATLVWTRRAGLALLAALVVFAGCGGDDGDGGGAAGPSSTTSAPDAPIVRDELADAAPANASGQRLYLQRVTIAPGARLDTHRHEGTQIARVVEGTLTYDIVEGTAEVARGDGTAESVTGPATITLEPGDALTETDELVHFGSNDGDAPVVVLVAALLADGAPLATPVPE